jgi:hypothetical protein
MRLFAFDYETFLIQPYLLAPPIVCMSVAIDDEEAIVYHVLDSRLRALLVEALTTPGCMMVAHNAAYEAVCTMAKWPELTELLFAKLDAGEIYCTLLGEKLISIGEGDHDKEFGLDDCLERHGIDLPVDKECHWRLRYGLLATTPCELWPQDAWDYSVLDAEAARQLYRSQVERYSKYIHDCTARWTVTPRGGHRVFLPGQTWASVALYLTSAVGFPTDPEAADVLWHETIDKLKLYEGELKRVGFLLPKREKGVLKYTLKKEPAEKLMLKCFQEMGREPARGNVTPAMLVKAYKNVGQVVEWENKGRRKDKKVEDSDITEAIENGCSPKDLIGNIKLNEEACINSGHPLLLAYTKYSQADTLKSKVKRLQKALIQTWYNALVETGRTSSSQGEDPKAGEPWTSWGMQVQNLPRAGDDVEEDIT